MARSTSGAFLLAVVLAATAGSASAGTHLFFELPGGNPQCELAAGLKGLGAFVYCLAGAAPFICTAERTGMRCVVTKLGHGFLLSRTEVKRI